MRRHLRPRGDQRFGYTPKRIPGPERADNLLGANLLEAKPEEGRQRGLAIEAWGGPAEAVEAAGTCAAQTTLLE